MLGIPTPQFCRTYTHALICVREIRTQFPRQMKTCFTWNKANLPNIHGNDPPPSSWTITYPLKKRNPRLNLLAAIALSRFFFSWERKRQIKKNQTNRRGLHSVRSEQRVGSVGCGYFHVYDWVVAIIWDAV